MKLATPVAFVLLLLVAQAAYPCETVWVGPGPPWTTEDYVRRADAIVRAKARAQVDPPNGPSRGPGGVLTSRIVFDVVEVLKGGGIGLELTLPGLLTEWDDFNEGPVPYTAARGTTHGPCSAEVYRSGGEFLLLLSRRPSGEYTAASTAPVNEQIRGGEDPWLLWVRQQLK